MKRLTVMVFTLALAGAAWAGEWHIETVDPGKVGTDTSLALDSSNFPHITYYDWFNGDLKYAYWDGNEWHTETVDSTGYVGRSTSLGLDSFGNPNISYYDDTLDAVKYARWDGYNWQTEIVDSTMYVSAYTSLELDTSDYPHISYRTTNGGLKYAAWDGSEWHIETVDMAGYLGMYSSLALDSADYPHISYFDHDNSCLKYARWDGADWQIETVDSAGDVGYFTSLALDSSDYPHISYRTFDGDLKYAAWFGGSWHIETVEHLSCEGSGYCSLALDSDNYPNIAYHDDHENTNLKYAHWDGADWHIYIVDSEGNVGQHCSLKLDSSDNPHISYYDDTNDDLKYAYWEGGPEVEGAEVFANVNDEGVLVGWTVTGDAPASFSVLRSVGEGELVEVSGALPGAAARWLDADVESGAEYRYWLEVVDEDGTVSRFGPTEPLTFPGAARELALSVYPSPASGSFTVDYTLPKEGPITISLYDLSGRRIATVLDGEMTAGRHDISCDASLLPPGVYLARLTTDSGTLTRRVVIAR